MQKMLRATVLLFLCMITAGCAKPPESHGTATEFTVNTVEGLYLKVQSNAASATGLTLTVKNETGKIYTFGSAYWVEKWIEDNWYQIPDIVENVAFSAEALRLDENGKKEMDVNWEWRYGILAPGNYRIIKDCICPGASGDFDTYYVADNFVIK